MFDDSDELKIDDDKFEHVPGYDIPEDTFRRVIADRNIDYVLFVEEQYQVGLGNICKELGMPNSNIIMQEFFNPDEKDKYLQFDKLIFPVKCGHSRAIMHGYDSVYIKWGIDIDVWGKDKIDRGKDIVRFVHCAGWGGVHNRRQTHLVVDAFSNADLKNNAMLLVHQQIANVKDKVVRSKLADNITLLQGNVSREQIISLYQWSDVAIAPSLWEGLGYSLIEPQAMGLPVITVDASPMNEWVINGITGSTCKPDNYKRYKGINVVGSHLSVDTLSDAIKSYVENIEMILGTCESIKENCKTNYDWNANGIKLVKHIESHAECMV